MNPNSEQAEKLRLINKYRPRIAKHFRLNEEDVFPMTCKKHKVKMYIGEYGWYCKKCKKNEIK